MQTFNASMPIVLSSNANNVPLKVVRELTSNSLIGRMVMCGRMDDICAELERLSDLEILNPTQSLTTFN
jgi:hypothetical protein